MHRWSAAILPILFVTAGCVPRSELRGTLAARPLAFDFAVHKVTDEGCLEIYFSNQTDYCAYLDEKHQYGEKDAPDDLNLGVCVLSWETERGTTPVGTYQANEGYEEMHASGVLYTVSHGKEELRVLSSGFVRLDEVGTSTVRGYADVRLGPKDELATLVGPFVSRPCN